MATVTLHPFGSGPTRNRANAPAAVPVEPTPRLPAFWGSLFHASAAAANDEAPRAEKSSALVGGLWIQIR
jgi:hypothetical protein